MLTIDGEAQGRKGINRHGNNLRNGQKMMLGPAWPDAGHARLHHP